MQITPIRVFMTLAAEQTRSTALRQPDSGPHSAQPDAACRRHRLMGALSDDTLGAGGEIIGLFPAALMERANAAEPT